MLEEAVGNEYRIYGKIRIADAIKPNHKEKTSEWQTHFNKIKAKHFDFILCDKETNKIVCAIELNDRTHLQKARAERDRFIDEVCREVGLPLLFIENSREYNKEEITNTIYKAIKKEDNEFQFFSGEGLEKDEFWKKTIEKKRKDRSLEIVMLSYLLISSLFIIWWKHREMAFMFRKHVLGHNIVVVDNKIVDLDNPIVQQKREAERKYIYEYNGEKIGEGTKDDYWKYQEELNNREKKKKIPSVILSSPAQKPARKNYTEQKIHCWLDENGKTVYSNVEPINKNLVPCQ